MLRLAIGRPSCVRRISGSLPRLPTRSTLFTLPAIAALHSISPGKNHWSSPPSAGRLQFLTCRQFLDLSPCPLAASASGHLKRPYTLAKPADLAIPRQVCGYPHIASPLQVFQLCSGISRRHGVDWESTRGRLAVQLY